MIEIFAQIIRWPRTIQRNIGTLQFFTGMNCEKLAASSIEIGRTKVIWSTLWIDITLCTPDPVSVDCCHLEEQVHLRLCSSHCAEMPGEIVTLSWSEYTLYYTFLNNEWVILSHQFHSNDLMGASSAWRWSYTNFLFIILLLYRDIHLYPGPGGCQ